MLVTAVALTELLDALDGGSNGANNLLEVSNSGLLGLRGKVDQPGDLSVTRGHQVHLSLHVVTADLLSGGKEGGEVRSNKVIPGLGRSSLLGRGSRGTTGGSSSSDLGFDRLEAGDDLLETREDLVSGHD